MALSSPSDSRTVRYSSGRVRWSWTSPEPGGHVVLLGSPQSGKTTALKSLMVGAALTHTPAEVGFYAVDMAGSSLRPLAGLPHVGDVATRFDVDKIRRTIAEVAHQLATREHVFSDHRIETAEQMRALHRSGSLPELACADVFLVIDGWWTFREEFGDLAATVQDLVARGLGYGIHVVLTTSRWADFRLQMQSMLGTRIELRLNDPLDSTIDRKLIAAIRPGDQGRCVTQTDSPGRSHYPSSAATTVAPTRRSPRSTTPGTARVFRGCACCPR